MAVGIFNSSIFNNQIFNTGGGIPVVIDTHDGAEWHRRKKRQAKLAEAAIYRNAPRQQLKLKTPLQIDEIKTKEPQQAREITVAPFIYEIGRMPLPNPDQWLLDDDEEAIAWLLQ